MLNPGRVLRTKMFVDYIELKMGKKGKTTIRKPRMEKIKIKNDLQWID